MVFLLCGSALASSTEAVPLPADAVPAAEPAPAAPAAEVYPIAFEGQCTPDDPHFDLEVLFHEGRYDEGLALARKRLAEKADKDLYWMAARFMFEVGERFQRDDGSVDKEAWYREMLDLCEAGLAMAPGDPHLRFARGVAMGRLGTTRGVLSSLFMAKDVESDWLAVAHHPTFRYASIGGEEELPCDAYHALGIYYRLVPDWWIVQVLAGTRGDLEQSLAWHRKAVDCGPDNVQNWKELGVTELCIGQKKGDEAMLAAGKASLQKVTTLRADTARSKVDVRHAQMLLRDPSLACEYSRDGQQDLDEDKLSH